MNLTVPQWHTRFQQQATWTQDLRQHLFKQAGIKNARRILEVGCGTGAVLSGLQTNAQIVGIDIDTSRLTFAQDHVPEPAAFIAADGHQLPFSSSAFDIAFCHFLLLWVNDPAQILTEMMRATRSNGAIIAFAEPDYGGRIDFPAELAQIGDLQAASLKAQGADTNMGRQLTALFSTAGLHDVQSGVLQGQWSSQPIPETIESEWQVIRHDLHGRVAPAEIDRLYRADMAAWNKGMRVQFVPTFYAYGIVP